MNRSGSVLAQRQRAASTAVEIAHAYQAFPNITYLKANNVELKLDIYTPRAMQGLYPTLVYFHGGGWMCGTKDGGNGISTVPLLATLPYIESGWAVVNVEYRLGSVSLAPAAVEDCRSALRWIIKSATQYNFDANKLVLTGHSAGGHLALTTGMLTASAGLDRQSAGPEDIGEMKVAAIVNWFGITDVADLLEGPNQKWYAVAWLGSMSNRDEIARLVSPLNYVRPGLPPVLSIHGTDDPWVPYSHAARLHDSLSSAGVPNELVAIPGGGHGAFQPEENSRAFDAIRGFLLKHGVTPQ